MKLKDRIKERLIARSDINPGVIAPTATPQLTTGRNKHGDIMSSRTGVNASPRRTAFGQAMTQAGRRRGQTFQVGRTQDGKVVHIYKDGTRIVLNRKP